jgi:hypothetical protein
VKPEGKDKRAFVENDFENKTDHREMLNLQP